MAERPWVTPDEIRKYSERESVQERSDEKLAVDIARAEAYVIRYTQNTFGDYDTIPGNVRIAVILLAEAYAANAAEFGSGESSVKSESLGSYSYTAAEADSDEIIDSLDLSALLAEYIAPKAKSTVTMRLRRL